MKGSLETMENENQQIKCDHCDFTTTSKKGLKTHTKRKHSVANQEQFPISCELCKEELGNKKDMRNHMLTHTYSLTQNNQLKCEECTFIGDNEWTMYIHFGKQHSKPIECGLCQFKAKNSENLDIHLQTCEIYECRACEHVTTQIAGMKTHIKESNEE